MRRAGAMLAVALASAPLPACHGSSSEATMTLATPAWSQWGGNPRHDGAASGTAQDPARILATFTVDPFASQEAADSRRSALLVHYQAPLLAGDDVFMTVKSGTWRSCDPPGSRQPAPCGSDAWDGQVWNVQRLTWAGTGLSPSWQFASDWKPLPDAGALAAWEPVFHPILAGGSLWVPAAGGSVVEVDAQTGTEARRVSPFSGDPTTYVAGPLAASEAGDVFYTAISVDPTDPWGSEVRGAWLVKVPAQGGAPVLASFETLVSGSPAPGDPCTTSFSPGQLPWPPSPDAVAPTRPCGSQRPGVNVAPAIAPDGTVYVVSRAHFNGAYAFLVAVTPNLAPLWAASLRDRLRDGCGGPSLPPTGSHGGCRAGAGDGVDPATNQLPAGIVTDLSSSSPVVAPDGSILYGAYSRYNGARGHLFRFSAEGAFLGAYDFGWDVTPAVYAHDGTWSVVIKDNHYEVPSYCSDMRYCTVAGNGPYRITQLSPDLRPEWSFTPEPTPACTRQPDGTVTCSQEPVDEPEWCINAPVVDRSGVVLAINEDGNLYAISQGGSLLRRTFLQRAAGAAYTPLALDAAGRVYAQNYGQLFALGQ